MKNNKQSWFARLFGAKQPSEEEPPQVASLPTAAARKGEAMSPETIQASKPSVLQPTEALTLAPRPLHEKCPRCEAAHEWWGKAALLGDAFAGERPHDFAGVCHPCRKGYCMQHAPDDECPACGGSLLKGAMSDADIKKAAEDKLRQWKKRRTL